MRRPSTDGLLLLLGLSALTILVAVISRQILFADGSYLLVAAMDGSFTEIWRAAWHRVAAYALTQGPAILLAQFGVGAEVLSMVYGASFHGLALLSLAACWALSASRRELMVFPFASFFGLQVGALLFPSEVHILVDLYWPLLFAVLFPPRGQAAKAAVLIVALLWGFVHEAALFGSAILLPLALWQARRRPEDRNILLAIAALSALAISIAAVAALDSDPVRAGNRDNFLGAWRQLRYHYVFLVGATVAGAALIATVLPPRAGHILAWTAGAGAMIALAYVASRPALARPEFHYAVRLAMALALPALGAAAAWTALRPGQTAIRQAMPALVLLALGQTAYGLLLTGYWLDYLGTYRQVLASHSGLVDVSDTPLSQDMVNGRPMARFNWNWTHPLLSLSLAPSGRVHVLIDDRSRTFTARNPAAPQSWPGWRRPFDTTTLESAQVK